MWISNEIISHHILWFSVPFLSSFICSTEAPSPIVEMGDGTFQWISYDIDVMRLRKTGPVSKAQKPNMITMVQICVSKFFF